MSSYTENRLGARSRKAGEMGEGGQTVQMFCYKINRSWGCNAQYDD